VQRSAESWKKGRKKKICLLPLPPLLLLLLLSGWKGGVSGVVLVDSDVIQDGATET
jgi:hypothetical protein